VIDPKASVDPSAELDSGVEVGPFAVIGPGVRIGSGTRVGPHVVITGDTTIGEDNRIFQFASIGEEPQDLKYAGEDTRLVIGNRNRIREFATVHKGTVQDEGITSIGDDNLLMAYTHVAHDCRIGNNVVMANAASLAGHVKIGDWAILGGFSGVHQFCQIGAHAFIGADSKLFKDLPPYVMASRTPAVPYGINREGLARRGFSEDAILGIKRAYKILYKRKLSLDDALVELRELTSETPEVGLLVDFIEGSSRSIVR
jgi:UDP-N-acetylglucosamine acyltransferase